MYSELVCYVIVCGLGNVCQFASATVNIVRVLFVLQLCPKFQETHAVEFFAGKAMISHALRALLWQVVAVKSPAFAANANSLW
jgi:hypothetical protein